MRTRSALAATVLVLLAGCSGDDGGDRAGSRPEPTTDADCARRLPDAVFATLGWTPTGEAATATVRGCHREAQQGYVEVRERGDYEGLCATLDRSGEVAPGTPVDWLGAGVTACAVEPAGGVGQTRVAVRDGDRATLITVVALTATPQDAVRAAVGQLVQTRD